MQPHQRLCAFVPANSGSVRCAIISVLPWASLVIVVAASACAEGGALMCGLFPARASEDRATCASPLGAIWVAPTQVHDATAAQSSGECLRVSMALCPQVAEIYRCDADVMQRRSMRYAVGRDCG